MFALQLIAQVSFNTKLFDGPVSALTVAGVGVKKDKVLHCYWLANNIPCPLLPDSFLSLFVCD